MRQLKKEDYGSCHEESSSSSSGKKSGKRSKPPSKSSQPALESEANFPDQDGEDQDYEEAVPLPDIRDPPRPSGESAVKSRPSDGNYEDQYEEAGIEKANFPGEQNLKRPSGEQSQPESEIENFETLPSTEGPGDTPQKSTMMHDSKGMQSKGSEITGGAQKPSAHGGLTKLGQLIDEAERESMKSGDYDQTTSQENGQVGQQRPSGMSAVKSRPSQDEYSEQFGEEPGTKHPSAPDIGSQQRPSGPTGLKSRPSKDQYEAQYGEHPDTMHQSAPGMGSQQRPSGPTGLKSRPSQDQYDTQYGEHPDTMHQSAPGMGSQQRPSGPTGLKSRPSQDQYDTQYGEHPDTMHQSAPGMGSQQRPSGPTGLKNRPSQDQYDTQYGEHPDTMHQSAPGMGSQQRPSGPTGLKSRSSQDQYDTQYGEHPDTMHQSAPGMGSQQRPSGPTGLKSRPSQDQYDTQYGEHPNTMHQSAPGMGSQQRPSGPTGLKSRPSQDQYDTQYGEHPDTIHQSAPGMGSQQRPSGPTGLKSRPSQDQYDTQYGEHPDTMHQSAPGMGSQQRPSGQSAVKSRPSQGEYAEQYAEQPGTMRPSVPGTGTQQRPSGPSGINSRPSQDLYQDQYEEPQTSSAKNSPESKAGGLSQPSQFLGGPNADGPASTYGSKSFVHSEYNEESESTLDSRQHNAFEGAHRDRGTVDDLHGDHHVYNQYGQNSEFVPNQKQSHSELPGHSLNNAFSQLNKDAVANMSADEKKLLQQQALKLCELFGDCGCECDLSSVSLSKSSNLSSGGISPLSRPDALGGVPGDMMPPTPGQSEDTGADEPIGSQEGSRGDSAYQQEDGKPGTHESSLFKEAADGVYNKYKLKTKVGIAEKYLCINCLYTKFAAPNRKYWRELTFSDADDFRKRFLGRQFYCYFCKQHQRSPLTLRKFHDPLVDPSRNPDPAFILHDGYSILLGVYPYRTTSLFDKDSDVGKKHSLGNPSGIAKLKHLPKAMEHFTSLIDNPHNHPGPHGLPFEDPSASHTVSHLSPHDKRQQATPEQQDGADCFNVP